MLHSKGDDDIPAAAAVVAADPALANTIEYEAIPKLLFVDMQQEDEEKVAAAVTKLTDLLNALNANQKVNAEQTLSVGAIAIILLLMRKWYYSRSIQFHGCRVLSWLTYYNGGDERLTYDVNRGPWLTVTSHEYARAISLRGSESGCSFKDDNDKKVWLGYCNHTAPAVSIIKSGGIETIMAAMKSFPDDDDINGYGCNAIGNAFYFTNPAIDKAMAHFVHELNGIELVVPVMKKFQNNASVQESGCKVLLQLSKNQVLRDALKKGGAVSAVGEVTEKHYGSSVQSKAAAFFHNMFG
jgi:hypothetical protein